MEVKNQINYVILLPSAEDSQSGSPFQGFSESLLTRSWWIRTILRRCPPTVSELYRQSQRTMELRLVGLSSYRILPLLDSELFKLQVDPINPFWIVLIDSTTKQLAEKWCAKQAIPVHIANMPGAGNEPSLPTRQSVRQHCDTVIALLETAFPNVDCSWAVKARATTKDWNSFPIEFGFSGHNITIPNELLLMSVGGAFAGQQQALVGSDAQYLSRMLQVADEAVIIRRSVPVGAMSSTIPLMPTVILAVPGFFRHASKKRPKKGHERLPLFRMLRILQQQKTYAMQVEDESEMPALMQDPASCKALLLRTLEQCAFTDALSVRAASYLCPVLRLPPSVNHTSSALIRLADCLRSDSPSQRKVSRLTQQLISSLEKAVPSEIIERIDLPHSGIKLVSDAPLELLPIRGLPLMLRHITSRIPVTPGNQAYLELLPHDTIELTTEHFKDTLVIRSFQDDDPIRLDLERAVRHYSPGSGPSFPVRFVDVRTQVELVRTLTDFHGALVVFDCHGRHRNDDYGQLQLADELVNPWELRNKVRVPPIAFLCACDTHAYDRSHVTPGSGLLACGVRAVISTVLPVHSQNAAMFAARLLYRIYEYLPQVTNGLQQIVRWDHFFSMLQRMMFVTELIDVIKVDNVDAAWQNNVMVRATESIHTRYDWYEAVLADVAESTGLTLDAINQLKSDNLSFPEAFKYLHLGNPESIVLRPKPLQGHMAFN